MAQGRPPRRSTTKRDPVTIDLEAEKKHEGSEAKAGKARPSGDDVTASDAPAVAGPPSAPAQDKAGSTAAASAAAAMAGKPDAKPGEAEAKTETSAKTEKATAGKEAMPPKAEASATKGDAKPAGAGPAADGRAAAQAKRPETTTTATKPARPSSGSGRAFAAGLLGGIIVVGLAFALESVGILPAPGSRSSSETRSAVAALSAEVDGLKKSVAGMKSAGSAGSRTAQAVQALQGQVKSVSAELDQLKGSAQSGGMGVADVQKGLSDADARLDELSKKVSALQASAGQGARETRLAAIVAATALKSAIDRGGSFASELKVYQSIVQNDQATAPLAKLAAQGVPSKAELQEAFPDVADSIMSAVRGNSADSSVFDRLLNSARSMIKVRPTGDIPGKSPAAIVARMGFKLKKGDLKGVVGEWQSLPEAGQKASQSFIDNVKKRMTAEQAADAALQQASAPTDNQG